MEGTKTHDRPTENAVKLIGEAIMPGASLLMDGKILSGGAHLLAGAAAKAWLGPLGVALVIANSYAQSTTGKNLLKQFTGDGHKPASPAPSTVTTTATVTTTPATPAP